MTTLDFTTIEWLRHDPTELVTKKLVAPRDLRQLTAPANALQYTIFLDYLRDLFPDAKDMRAVQKVLAYLAAGHPYPTAGGAPDDDLVDDEDLPLGYRRANGWGPDTLSQWLDDLQLEWDEYREGSLKALTSGVETALKGNSGGLIKELVLKNAVEHDLTGDKPVWLAAVMEMASKATLKDEIGRVVQQFGLVSEALESPKEVEKVIGGTLRPAVASFCEHEGLLRGAMTKLWLANGQKEREAAMAKVITLAETAAGETNALVEAVKDTAEAFTDFMKSKASKVFKENLSNTSPVLSEALAVWKTSAFVIGAALGPVSAVFWPIAPIGIGLGLLSSVLQGFVVEVAAWRATQDPDTVLKLLSTRYGEEEAESILKKGAENTKWLLLDLVPSVGDKVPGVRDVPVVGGEIKPGTGVKHMAFDIGQGVLDNISSLPDDPNAAYNVYAKLRGALPSGWQATLQNIDSVTGQVTGPLGVTIEGFGLCMELAEMDVKEESVEWAPDLVSSAKTFWDVAKDGLAGDGGDAPWVVHGRNDDGSFDVEMCGLRGSLSVPDGRFYPKDHRAAMDLARKYAQKYHRTTVQLDVVDPPYGLAFDKATIEVDLDHAGTPDYDRDSVTLTVRAPFRASLKLANGDLKWEGSCTVKVSAATSDKGRLTVVKPAECFATMPYVSFVKYFGDEILTADSYVRHPYCTHDLVGTDHGKFVVHATDKEEIANINKWLDHRDELGETVRDKLEKEHERQLTAGSR